ncbi:hypothetical protein PV350_19405 [Streptomyces sp. PA03-6a]|nr:hypothetical protein [Streptomyces sp. PA03-6a]
MTHTEASSSVNRIFHAPLPHRSTPAAEISPRESFRYLTHVTDQEIRAGFQKPLSVSRITLARGDICQKPDTHTVGNPQIPHGIANHAAIARFAFRPNMPHRLKEAMGASGFMI